FSDIPTAPCRSHPASPPQRGFCMPKSDNSGTKSRRRGFLRSTASAAKRAASDGDVAVSSVLVRAKRGTR
ncbi:MAG TPA: hypothetical protein VHY80_13175, partial [Stellaceae bacterium]|nr:hypothetical protein [Stellaceae bacterium]